MKSLRSSLVLFGLITCMALAKPGLALRVGIVLDKGGKDDKSFNASAYEGIKRAEKNLNIKAKVIETSDVSALEPSLRMLAARGEDLIIAVGFSQSSAAKKVSKDFPKTKFLIIDAQVDGPNVRSVLFEEHEGSFLVGALAALKSTSGTVGFVGGMEIPMIKRFQLGYKSGAEYINPKIKVLSNYIGATGEAWKNPMKAKELALDQYQKGADVIFSPAGSSSLGVFDAAEELKKYAIGVDSNQNGLKPGRILTSMVKNVDQAVYDTIEQAAKGAFTAGLFRRGIQEGGVNYSLDEHNRSLITPEMEKKVNQIRDDIQKKKLKVPDYYKTSQNPYTHS